MRRYEAMEEAVKSLDHELIISNIGRPSDELHSIRDRPENFYMLGSMGLASSIGLGIALSSRRRVIVFDGDGSILMNMGSLATISYHAPSNLRLVIFDNASYGSTGDQDTIASKIPLEKIVEGCGLETRVIEERQDISWAMEWLISGEVPKVLVIKVEKGSEKVPNVPLDHKFIRDRFMESLRQV